MKKICFILCLLSFLSAMPCFAMKVIINNEMDRTVPSRCSGPDALIIQDDNNQYNYNVNNKQMNVSLKRQNDKFDRYYKEILGQDFRTELLGTRWNYPEDEPNQNQNIQSAENYNPNVYVEPQSKNYIREAADYKFRDTITGYIYEIVP